MDDLEKLTDEEWANWVLTGDPYKEAVGMYAAVSSRIQLALHRVVSQAMERRWSDEDRVLIQKVAKDLYENEKTLSQGHYPGWQFDELPTNPGTGFSHIKSNCIFWAEIVLESLWRLGYKVVKDE